MFHSSSSISKLSAEGLEKIYWIINTFEKKYHKLCKIRIQFSTKDAVKQLKEVLGKQQPTRPDFVLLYHTDTIGYLEINFSCNTYNRANSRQEEAISTIDNLYKRVDISHATHEIRGSDTEEIEAALIPQNIRDLQKQWIVDHPNSGTSAHEEAFTSVAGSPRNR